MGGQIRNLVLAKVKNICRPVRYVIEVFQNRKGCVNAVVCIYVDVV